MRGLNSVGDEIIRVGPVPFGTYHGRFVKSFDDVKVIPVLGMGRGSAEEMGERALAAILRTDEFRTAKKIHLVGHSLGGFVARYLAHKPEIREKTVSVLTICTPHRGAKAAEPPTQSDPFSKFVLKLVRSDVETSASYYVTATLGGAQRFNERYPDVEGIHYASIVGQRHFRNLPVGFQILERRHNPIREPSDGLITLESQKWGHILGQFSLDHLETIGLSGHATPWERLRFSREFKRQSKLLRTYWQSLLD